VVVVRGGVEPPTFRFSGRTFTLLRKNGCSVDGGCWVHAAPVAVAAVVTAVVNQAARVRCHCGEESAGEQVQDGPSMS
jgi:hypothetical protein